MVAGRVRSLSIPGPLSARMYKIIKGINFGYQVALREEGITYLNKLAKFVGPHELECTDNKGNKTTVTGARFVIAVGGPTDSHPFPVGSMPLLATTSS